MIARFALLAAALLLAGCKEGAEPVPFKAMPKELEGCVLYDITTADSRNVLLARCPHSTTSLEYRMGKSQRRSIVVDGVEYAEKETQ